MKILLFMFFIGFSAMGCKDRSQDEGSALQLPPITQTGANTAGCVINGKTIIPKDGVNGLSGSEVNGLSILAGSNFYEPILGNDYFSIKVSNLKDSGKSYWIYLHIDNLSRGIGEYSVNQSNAEFYSHASNTTQIIVRETNKGVSTRTYLSSDRSGKITITTFNNSICSGIFCATLYNKDNPSEKIEVRDGRFDIKIR